MKVITTVIFCVQFACMPSKAVAAENICCIICKIEGGTTALGSAEGDVMNRSFLFEGLNYECITSDIIENFVGFLSGGESGCIIAPPREWISDLDTSLFIQFESLYSNCYAMCIVKHPDTIIEYMDMQFVRIDTTEGNDMISWQVDGGICYLEKYAFYYFPAEQ